MKRLVALSKSTMSFGIDTSSELEFIKSNNNSLTEDKLVAYYDAKEMAIYGSIYYTHKNDTINYYVAEAFGFKDVDKSQDSENDVLAFVITKLDDNGNATDDRYYEEFQNANLKQPQNVNLHANGEGLIQIPNAKTFEDAQEELAKTTFKEEDVYKEA